MHPDTLFPEARERLARHWSPADGEGLVEETLAAELDRVFAELSAEHGPLAPTAAAELRARLVLEVCGLTPVAQWASDPTVTEILINGPRHVFVERGGAMGPAGLTLTAADIRTMLNRMLPFGLGRRLDASCPWVDLSLPGGMRVNIVIPPAVIGGAHITIRRHIRELRNVDVLRERGMFDATIQAWLEGAVATHANVLISGASGSGKTTLLDKLSAHFDPRERIVTIEDTPELDVQKPDVVRLVTRAPNVEGRGEITTGDLFRNALRMHPSRILLGEIRGKEALDYLSAINSGHRGTFAIIHAATPEEALVRLEHLVAQGGLPIASNVLRAQMARGLDAIVQITQLPDGSRRVTRVSEVVGIDSAGELVLRDVFVWTTLARRPDGRLDGGWSVVGSSRVAAAFPLAGVPMPPGIVPERAEER